MNDDEVAIVSHYLQQRDVIGLGLPPRQVSALLSEIAQRKLEAEGVVVTYKTARSRNFRKALMKRTHQIQDAVPLSRYKTAALSLSRARARRPEVLLKFSEILDGLLAEKNITEFPADHTFNMDEVGFDVESRQGSVIASKSKGRHERIRTSEHASKWVSALLCCRADGDLGSKSCALFLCCLLRV